jgi:hypothetical protein
MINEDEDISSLQDSYIREGELAFAKLEAEFSDTSTDALLIQLNNNKSWKYAAVIDCRGPKKYKAYFSKWHEVAHVLTEPRQAVLFHRSRAERKDPEEILVDRVASDFAFYQPLFLPELLARTKGANRLTFEVIEDVRAVVCAGASREATIRAAVARAPFPQFMIIADYGLKKKEQRTAEVFIEMGLYSENETPFERKLRAIQVAGNDLAKKLNLQIHRNMEVPDKSVISTVYNHESLDGESLVGQENLDWWKHSSGDHLRSASVTVEARKIGRRVFALITPNKYK